MQKINLTLLFILSTFSLLFSQSKYETFSYLGRSGLVDKQTLEVEIEPKYKDIEISADRNIFLLDDEDQKYHYDPISK